MRRRKSRELHSLLALPKGPVNKPSPSLSRRSFLEVSAAAGGALLIGFRVPARLAGEFAPNAFIRIDPYGVVTLVMHKVEMGQGTYTAMSMLLAEELEMDLSQGRPGHAPAA